MTVTTLCSAGDHVVCGENVYGGTHRLMDKVLGMRLENRPESVGSFASNLRGFEQVREDEKAARVGAACATIAVLTQRIAAPERHAASISAGLRHATGDAVVVIDPVRTRTRRRARVNSSAAPTPSAEYMTAMPST